eukprot:CAMPEP_0170583506 /NCGR_PEP_ID=MMETSP0224-20130122/8173_1 /TAXON_ID=285029 /ORGANISM="Togula jolla, Strain CCCM 725" /LENGTH=370 /DNA_ID=CAMNT_0010906841 /DNA_START=22 /DNA_END=1134 /DNA_ORIENTATION=+
MALADPSHRRKEIEAMDSIVPIINIAPFLSGAEGSDEVVAEIGRACEEIGFFVVVGHGITKDVIDAVWSKTLDFFDLPLEAKEAMITDNEATYPYGYSPLGGETLSRGKQVDLAAKKADTVQASAGDLKEMFSIGPSNPAAGMPARRWPQHPPGFDSAWEAYYENANGLAQNLLRAFASALGLEASWFEGKSARHISALRANNYPDQKDLVIQEGSIRCSAHTDYGTLTILKSGGPGLQVSKDRENPVWHDVPFVEDGFVINLGDLMRRWTNDRWSSTLHRVVNPPPNEAWGRRMALAFFHNLDKDAIVETLPSCLSEARPALYDPIVAGDFLMLKHLASIGKAEEDAHLRRRVTDQVATSTVPVAVNAQ